jgi:hypothetical protein
MILSPNGHLWVIDWEDSGFYPRFFERLGMDRYVDDMPESWNRMRDFMVGSFPAASDFWRNLGCAIFFKI